MNNICNTYECARVLMWGKSTCVYAEMSCILLEEYNTGIFIVCTHALKYM